MPGTITCQGRVVDESDLAWLRELILHHPDWSRHQITKRITEAWNWRNAAGHLKTFAARTFIDKLEAQSLIELPPIQTQFRREPRPPWPKTWTPPQSDPVEGRLSDLMPLEVLIPKGRSDEEARFGYYLAQHHYLGFQKPVGQNLKYLIRDRYGRDLACLLFGSAAWQTEARDAFIGWKPQTRQNHINLMTNNTRFLILPWVRVPHLASHVLGLVLRRLRKDWLGKYGHPVHLVETFVQQDRFKGSSYRAANWIAIGQSRGRGRQDRYNTHSVPVKDIYVYPLTRRFREALCKGDPSC